MYDKSSHVVLLTITQSSQKVKSMARSIRTGLGAYIDIFGILKISPKRWGLKISPRDPLGC